MSIIFLPVNCFRVKKTCGRLKRRPVDAGQDDRESPLLYTIYGSKHVWYSLEYEKSCTMKTFKLFDRLNNFESVRETSKRSYDTRGIIVIRFYISFSSFFFSLNIQLFIYVSPLYCFQGLINNRPPYLGFASVTYCHSFLFTRYFVSFYVQSWCNRDVLL